MFGFSAKQTLDYMQHLYERYKVVTYPRTDSRYLTQDIVGTLPERVKACRVGSYGNLCSRLLKSPIKGGKSFVDDKKVSDHHAIIPTGQAPSTLVGLERQLYHLIALRFIAAFYPDCRFEGTTVEARAGDTAFKATGKVIVEPGWRTLFASDKNDKNADSGESADDAVLPAFTKGESGPHAPRLAKKTTQPPKLYTEGTLLRAMETAGKTVDDDELRDAMKENGIGRPSTRAAIIETLFKRKYIIRKNKNILATEAGINLIKIINEELLKSAKLTGIWENKLRRIERGQYSPGEFISELKAMISQIVINVLSDNSGTKINTSE